MKQIILTQLKQQETYVLNMRNRLVKRGLPQTNVTLQYERAKMIGMIDIAKSVGIDTTEFNWIYNI